MGEFQRRLLSTPAENRTHPAPENWTLGSRGDEPQDVVFFSLLREGRRGGEEAVAGSPLLSERQSSLWCRMRYELPRVAGHPILELWGHPVLRTSH
jgi:hypothetical protein